MKRKITNTLKSLFFWFLVIALLPRHALSQENPVWDWLINTDTLQGKHATGEHPRGLISLDDVPELRERIKTEPYKSWFGNFREKVRDVDYGTSYEAQETAKLAGDQCLLYTFTGEQMWADRAYSNLREVFRDDQIFNNPVSRGLTRAAMLRGMAVAYDHCYPAWSQPQRDDVNRQIYKITYATSANMGREANYSLVSNWMGVRWGAVLFASLVWDNPTAGEPSIMEPLRWDTFKRLSDHMEINLLENGWSAESMGYHAYNWSFIGPALIAFENRLGDQIPSVLRFFEPASEQSLWGIMTSTVSIERQESEVGVKADLSDDNQNMGSGLIGMGFRLYPERQLPALKWMHDYLDRGNIYSLLYYPETVEAKNPASIGWQTYADEQQGVVVFRDRFRNENDIVATYNTSAERFAGHWGPDANTVRLIGLGSFFIDGAGRTQLVAGQTNLFPGPVSKDQEGIKSEGTFLGFETLPDGSGFACGRGSNTGVKNQQTCFVVDYSVFEDQGGVFVLDYESDNGEIWRLNTPEYNTVDVHEGGFTITNPDGASLRATILGVEQPLDITTGRVRYGGETERHNPGIDYRGKNYQYNKWIDVANEGHITVVLTLLPKGASHPQISSGKTADEIYIDDHSIQLPKCEKNECTKK
ncbi:hypothetical protein ACG2F4_13980 [Halalkalibaculum sp. DA3122]|uniref:hypothetical protein n=1 Tax=Halalkalibaculum sp. DA3122 TaxID=3373607 RepID=UPI003754294E